MDSVPQKESVRFALTTRQPSDKARPSKGGLFFSEFSRYVCYKTRGEGFRNSNLEVDLLIALYQLRFYSERDQWFVFTRRSVTGGF
jgi:hypothetical protein